jgi:hypothetical protein
MTRPCTGSCSCPSPCAGCVHRETPWLSLSVPAYAVQEFGEEWIRARAASVPFRIPFSERRAAIKAARLRGKNDHAGGCAEVPEAEVTQDHNGTSKQAEGGK